MVKYFTIMGERCSGTNFLEKAIISNFELELVWHYGYKHFFGFYNYKNKNPIIENDNEVLFLGIVREPISWIDSLYDKKHHIPNINKNDINKFLNNEFYSINDKNEEIMEDRNYKNKKRYDNIFQMRNYKNHYLLTHHERVKNYLLIRYEDLKYKYDNILNFLQKKYNLKKKYNNFIKIYTYKGLDKQIYIEKKLKLNQQIINFIKNKLNKKQEKILGYL